MNSSNLSCQQSTKFEEQIIEKELLYSTYKNRALRKLKFISSSPQIKKSSIYTMEKFQEQQNALVLERNQKYLIIWIKSTIFHGKVSLMKTKIKLVNGLFFGRKNFLSMREDTIKKGKSMDYGKINSQTIRVEIFDFGEYYKELRIGRWNYLNFAKMICCGFYNKKGQKQLNGLSQMKDFMILKNHSSWRIQYVHKGRQMGYYVFSFEQKGIQIHWWWIIS
ncbi:unnamed protein product [Paramecium sonneborni]|uniref:Uncharacterized protein n=1 Tax=Paramecium sonneborni TaxID=65129 RepID=A0A8S1RMS0_9CILI|nr:unnamed protein product [Paramecium sonneborni]